jgi:putative component of membrane protein insertase Oxa1/YidC/SpoIIIJ protein YidD
MKKYFVICAFVYSCSDYGVNIVTVWDTLHTSVSASRRRSVIFFHIFYFMLL